MQIVCNTPLPIEAQIISPAPINAEIKHLPSILAEIRAPCPIDVSLGCAIIINRPENVEIYKGVYVITPSVEVQHFATKQRYMEEDVTVEEIPYAEVSNLAGGNTIIIG